MVNTDKKLKFIEKSIKKHGNKYNYSKVDYIDSLTKVRIICPTHGEFEQTPQAHVRGNGCPICANKKRGDTFRDNKEHFIEKANRIHLNKYDYSNVEFVNYETEVCIICPKHGKFWQTPQAHVSQKSGCPKCKGRFLSKEDLLQEFKEKHGDKYDYSKVNYTKMHDKVCIICPKHGEFWQTPSKHRLGQGCPICGKNARVLDRKLTTREFIEKAILKHGDYYDYSITKYKGTYEDVEIRCPKHGIFTQRANDHLNGHGCPKCGVIISKWEDEINDYINSLGIETIKNNRNILENGQELDIFIPSLSIAIECDGLLWHSSKYKNEKYHIKKTEMCGKQGIRLIHVFEDEWQNKKDIVKNILKTKIGKVNTKIYARQCVLKEIDLITKKKFIESNHIQGDVHSLVNIGLFFNNELVCVMTFGNMRINLGSKRKENEYELLRLCTIKDTVVVGGASKMLKYFINKYKPSKITSYCDRRWSNGTVYSKIGFSFSHVSKPNYYYILGNNRKNRFTFRKDILVGMGYDPSKSEREIMAERGINRIYDCGNLVYELNTN